MVKVFAKSFCNSKLTLKVEVYEKWITGAGSIEKTNLTAILAYFGLIFAFALRQR